jgi:hypothetical protein
MVARPWIRVYPQEPNDAIQLVEPVLDQEICQEGMLSPLHISTWFYMKYIVKKSLTEYFWHVSVYPPLKQFL